MLLRATLTSHGELPESHRADADALTALYGRKVTFVTLDGGRYRLNTQPRILKKGEPSRSLGAPRVLLFHRREVLEKEGQFALHAAIDRSGTSHRNLTPEAKALTVLQVRSVSADAELGPQALFASGFVSALR